jgi:hypothetical protein
VARAVDVSASTSTTVALPATEKPALESPRRERTPKPKVERPKGPQTMEMRGLRFADPAPSPEAAKPKKRAEKPKVKIDPKLITAARELRDRYLEQANDRLLIAPRGKYDVSRAVEPVLIPAQGLNIERPHALPASVTTAA